MNIGAGNVGRDRIKLMESKREPNTWSVVMNMPQVNVA